MRVLHVISGLEVGGAELMLARLLSRPGLVDAQPEVVSLTTVGPVGERLRALGVPVHALGGARGSPDPRLVLRLASLLRERRPAVVQSWMYHADLIAGLAAQVSGGPPVVWGIRNGDLDPASASKLTRLVVRTCAVSSRFLPSKIVSCSRRALEIHRTLGYDASKLLVIPNGFETGRFRPDPAARASVRAALGIGAEAPVVGLVGRFHPQKDHRAFVEAARLLSSARPNVRFVLCGSGVDSANAQLRGWLDEAGLRSSVSLLGSRDDVAQVTAAFDVAVSSSSSGEAFPNVLAEAMSCGVLCAATDVGDAAAILGGTGEVVPPREPALLAEAIGRMLDLPAEERARRGLAARRRIETEYGIDAIIQQYHSLHLQVAASN